MAGNRSVARFFSPLVSPLVIALATAVSAGAAVPQAITRIEYDGRLDYLGHARRPGDLSHYRSLQVCFTDGLRTRLEWTAWKEGDTLRIPESFLVTPDRVFHRDAP